MPEYKIPLHKAISFQRVFIDTMISPTVPYSEPLWFISCLWIGLVIYYATSPIREWVKRADQNKYFAILGGVFLYYSVVADTDMNSPFFILLRGLYACFFIYIGHYFYSYKDRIIASKTLILLGLIAPVLKYLYFNAEYPWQVPYIRWFDVRTMGLSHPGFLFWTLPLSLCEISFAMLIASVIKRFKLIDRVVIFVGQNSLTVFAIHLFLMWFIFDSIILKLLNYNGLQLSPGALKFTYFIFGLGGSIAYILISKKIISIFNTIKSV